MICMYLWGVVALELHSHPDHKKGTRFTPLALCIPFKDPSHTTKQKTNPFIARPLSESPKCEW